MSKDTNRPIGSDSGANLSDLAIRRMFGVPYQNARLTNWEIHGTPEHMERQEAVLDAVQKLCDGMAEIIHDGRNVIIYGPCGTGKDRLMVSLCRAALAHLQDMQEVQRWRGVDLWSRVRDSIKSNELESDLLREFRSPTVLIISDPMMPGLELTEFSLAWLYRILEHRAALGRGTWITTNAKDRMELAEYVGQANASRLRDNAIAIECMWSEFRAVGDSIDGR